MALELSTTEPRTGVVLPAAYVRVRRVLIDAESKGADLRVCTYANAEARREGREPLDDRVYTVADVPADEAEGRKDGTAWTDTFSAEALAATNPFAAAYAVLKARPEFADAQDV